MDQVKKRKRTKPKPVMIAGLPFTRREGRWGPELVHVFCAHSTPASENAQALGRDPSPWLVLEIDPNHEFGAAQTVTAILNRPTLDIERPVVLALCDALTETPGDVCELVDRDPDVLADAVVGTLLEFASEYMGVFGAAMDHSFGLSAALLHKREQQQHAKLESAVKRVRRPVSQ